MDDEKAERARTIAETGFRIIGPTGTVTKCDCCGRTGYLSTWRVDVTETGESLFYALSCLTLNTERARIELNRVQAEHATEARAAAQAEYAASPERAAYEERQDEAIAARLVGREFSEFCRVEYEASRAARVRIGAAHGVDPQTLI
ncbi:hypothetical protein H1O16_gp028 [Burkholderia phage BcepSaruman]|uniref:Uncharacterized protein n=1 Tax=Burkholderia phage BcepSaruman TaxID=2530032 RepID=A0A4D5ZCD4_9CAUD|nr:hypothetical protein H1O16_gp028 [Burkholderia phage BcepSaruman]QBX06441.1 hypothetical protein BcepSaruman_028 [Burkholderia phage BcepSaruman]